MKYHGNSKVKFLLLLKLLNKYSDDEHPLSAVDLCKLLQEQGINTDRKTIYRDVEALVEYGVDVIYTRTPKQGFFIAKRSFELAEVRLLMDAVLTAPFITSKKTDDLTKKLCGLLSCYQAKQVLNQIYVKERVKFENEEIYYNIDTINEAININKKIKFFYHHRIVVDRSAQFDRGREFLISPYSLIWVNDKYYLVGNYEKYNSVSNYRIDRMKSIRITPYNARPFKEVSEYRSFFDSADYLKKTFNMFNGNQEQIVLRCSNSLLDAVVDKFGSSTEFTCHDVNAFTVHANVYMSEGLIEWLMQYGDRIIVLSPQNLKDEIKKRVKAIYEAYKFK